MNPDLDEQFDDFHMRHPEVMRHLTRLCYQAVSRGRTRIGIGQLFEVLRWQRNIGRDAEDEFKLNNNLRSRYARRLMADHPEFEGLFETRKLGS